MLKKVISLFVLILLITSCAKKEPTIIFVAKNGANKFQQTETVKLDVGNPYGWIMFVNSDKPVSWKEEFILPSAPDTWGEGKAESNTNIKERTETPTGNNGRYFISNTWMVAQGDPVGDYVFKISVDNELVETFTIQFVKK